MAIETYISRCIDDIPEDAWNRLSNSSSVFYDYGWFKTFERELSDEPFYIIAKSDNQVVGILPGFIVRDPNIYTYHNPRAIIFSHEFLSQAVSYHNYANNNKQYFCYNVLNKTDKLLAPLLNKLFFPSVVFVSPLGYESNVLIDPARDNYQEIIDKMFEEIRGLILTVKAKSAAFPWVTSANTMLVDILNSKGFLKSYGKPYFELNVDCSSFDDYLKYLSVGRRYKVRKEIEKFNRSSITIKHYNSYEGLNKYIGRLAELITEHMKKYGHSVCRDDQITKLQDIYKYYGNNIDLYCAFKNENIVGFSIAINKNDVSYSKQCAFDESETHGTGAYFNMVYYNLIRNKIDDSKIKKICYGFAAEETKLDRGCQSHNAYNYIKLINPQWHKLLGRFLKHYNPARLGYYKEKYSHLVLEKEHSFLCPE